MKRNAMLDRAVWLLRKFRKYHKYIGLALLLFLLISAATGILLSLKKEVAIIQPPTLSGTTNSMENWLPLQEISRRAATALYSRHPDQAANPVDRLDVRPDKGVVKVLFANGWWDVQIDGRNGEVKSIAKRHSDWIEALHDGSIVSDLFKLISMNLLGLGLICMALTGFWLWYGPKRIRARRMNR